MSVKLFQTLSEKYSEIIGKEIGVTDESGVIIAHSNFQLVGNTDSSIIDFLQSKSHNQVIEDRIYYKVMVKNKVEFITFVKSIDAQDLKYLELFSLNILNLKSFYDEKYDKNTFVKNIIVENILPGDILLKAKELHVHEVIESLFPNKNKDFIIVIDNDNIVLVKEVKNKDDYKELSKIAKTILDTLNSELMVKASIGIGTIINNLKDITKSYKEAQMSMIIGNIFSGDQKVYDYNNLGLGRLVYHIPITLCQLFLDEVFKEKSADTLDNETMLTIQKFFENNLNVSETARQLYIHRNTLVYRLDKIKRLTGLELTSFDDAVTFKIAVLVRKYLASINE